MLSRAESNEKKYKCAITEICMANEHVYISKIVSVSRNEEIQETLEHARLLS